jgi:pimeloyl-ACP methyl ester carboxylesterase
MSEPAVRFAYADTPLGQLHYAETGEGQPVLLPHQSSRSWDEYCEVLPLLGENRRPIAMDVYVYGMSVKTAPGTPQTIEQYAQGVIDLADALALDCFAIVGDHTSASGASEVTAAVPDRITAAEFTDTRFRDTVNKDMHSNGDAAPPPAMSTSHRSRRTDPIRRCCGASATRCTLPARPDILNRCIRDAIAVGVRPTAGHRACARYVMKSRVGLATAPVRLLANTANPDSYPHISQVAAAYTSAESLHVVEIEGGTVPVMEHKTVEVLAALESFSSSVGV